MSIIINPNKGDPRPDEPEPKASKKVSYQHQKIVDQMLSAIATCSMDDELKTVLRMRIWGKDPKVFCPLSQFEVALILKTRIKNVKRWEEDALWNLEQFIKREGILTITQKFARDGNIKKILENNKRIIV